MNAPDPTRLFEEVCGAVDRGDIEYWRRVVADDAVFVGTAPDEVYRGKTEIVAALESYGAIPASAGEHESHVLVGSAWCYGDAVIAGVGARLSLVAVPAGVEWRIVHWHLSIAVPDEDAFPEDTPQLGSGL
jgi:hypothetical protein